ncbi:CheR family methyltransferase [Malaciobacter marinus]|jgi:chemotaxis protein methyltransferase CheR|uniref:CheR family methyltransferase n=1 Tax=Malaciobacter marinus TaxID=505249 RepID=UPI0009A8F5C7|nr:CheR family methyltransferase [Malaciobacter marinus]SKB58030.1 chemotaxis protein methyltransferase CheR [Malaciobacter marinus]
MINIVSQEVNNTLKIIVQNIEKEEDIKKLLSLLDYEKKSIEINFLNIQTIESEIILALNKIKSHLCIYSNETTLKNYLNQLGFEVKFIRNQNRVKRKKLNLEYLAIGGSAGSLKKFIDIVENLPYSQMSIFIVMHHRSDEKSSLSQILQTKTAYYKVVEAKSDMKIENSTIYTAPPGKHMIIIGGFIFLTNEEKRNFSKPSISTTFETLSNEYKNNLLAILVCGYGSDGSDSLKLLQKNESTVIIEDPKECEAKPMLENAIKTTYYDEILSLESINKYINNYLNNDPFNNTQLEEFLNKIYEEYGYDYRGYNLEHIKRRVKLFYSNLKPNNFLEFQNEVLSNKNIFKDLFFNISVNITTFYRNPEVFKKLKDTLLPKLDSFLDIKIWCAGCSSGEEPYSIAIFLKEIGLLNRSLIYATDLNEMILKNAKNGLYSKQNYKQFLKNYYQAGGSESFSKYFYDHGDFVEINEEIKQRILFFRHNLVEDRKINDFQLIFCRNVLIYFDKELKENIFKLFKQSLDSYGFLVLGESESLDNHEKFLTLDKKNRIYKRKI